MIFTGSIIASVLLTMVLTLYATSTIESVEFPTAHAISQTPLGTFYQPRDIIVNSTNGNILVADTQNHRVQIFNPDGSFNGTFGFPGNSPSDGSLNHPFGLHINSTGFSYVTSTFTNVVKIFDSSGTYVSTIGSAGTGLGEYYRPSGVTQNSTHIFIADTFNNRIQITDLSGNTVDTIP
jgi:hypothetical protein